MLHNNPNFNYDLCDTIFEIKQMETDTIMEVINQLMEVFHNVYFSKTKKHVYFLSKEIKYTQEIDPSHYLILRYAIGSIQDIVIELPLIKNGDSILINGNMYNPILQMIDRPLIIKKKNNIAVLMTNLGNFYTTPIVEDKIIRVINGINKKFMPPILVWFLAFLGLEGFEQMTGVKVIFGEENYDMRAYDFFTNNHITFDTTNIKDEFKDPKFDMLLKQSILLDEEIAKPNIAECLSSISVKDLVYKNKRGWESWLGAYDGPRVLAKVSVHQTIMPIIDIFSSRFMKYPSIVQELLRAFSTEIQPMDMKDINFKRFRCYEIFLINVMKHLYNLAMNCMYNKLTSISKEKRLRIYDNALSSHLTSYDGARNNSIMRLSEMTKISQTGDGGYTADMFVGSVRDIHESQYGTICPVTTPDREKCGVTLYLAPSKVSKFENMYYWPKDGENKGIRLPLRNATEYEEFLKTLPPKDAKPTTEVNTRVELDDPSKEEEQQEAVEIEA